MTSNPERSGNPNKPCPGRASGNPSEAVILSERERRHNPSEAPASGNPILRIGVDTGGTFTDIFAIDDHGRHLRWKVLSTPDDPARAILQGIMTLFPDLDPLSLEMVHGTTVGTNAFLERKGAITVLLTTHGFEDILWIGRQARPRLYDLMAKRPMEIISREQVFGIKERVGWKGDIITQLSSDEISRAREFCVKKGAESVAICLLHSYANSEHEKALKAGLEDLGIHVSISSEVLPEFREFERLSTTLINAYLGPVVGKYVDQLQADLSGARIFIQQSNGGCRPAMGIGTQAVHTLLSGPAGGVQAAWKLGRELGMENIITLDMGGTSTDVSLCPGNLTFTRDYKIQGFPVAIPILDIHTVGAGGGSIAWVDAGGMLKVGPQSAGADPGPACYGRGDEITVTDANLFLGRLQPESFLGGRMKIFPERVGPGLEKLGRLTGLSPEETALGIIRLVNMNMVQALRAVSIERGHDPRDFVLVCFGGAAGLHAAELAGELQIKKILLPSMAGVFSAQGMARADLVLHRSMALLTRRAQTRFSKLQDAVNRLTAGLYEEASRLGLSTDNMEIKAHVDARYQGQSFELTIPWSRDWVDAFTQEHQRLYGYAAHARDLEVTAVRARATLAQSSKLKAQSLSVKTSLGENTKLEKQCSRITGESMRVPIHFESGKIETLMIYREDMEREKAIVSGPALILDDFTTILVPPGWRVIPCGQHLVMESRITAALVLRSD